MTRKSKIETLEWHKALAPIDPVQTLIDSAKELLRLESTDARIRSRLSTLIAAVEADRAERRT